MIRGTLRRWAVPAVGVVVAAGLPAASTAEVTTGPTTAAAPPPPLPAGVHLAVGVQAATDLGAVRTARATCPAGSKLTGGGGEGVRIPGHNRQLTLTGLQPEPSLNRYTVTVTDAHPFSNNDEWTAVAYAICVVQPTAPSVIAASPAPSFAPLQQTPVSCLGNQVTGTGAKITAQEGEKVGLQAVTAPAALDEVQTVAQDGDGTVGQPWSLSAYALCAPPQTSIQSTTFTGPARSSLVRATCQAGVAFGAGAVIDNAPPDIALTRIRPGRELLTVEVMTVKVDSPNPSPPDANWTVTAQAVCNTNVST